MCRPRLPTVLVFSWLLAIAGAFAGKAAAAAAPASGQVGWLAVQGERVLAGQRTDELFVPGSVLKLVVTAAALHHLGPDFRATTEVRASGQIFEGRLSGDLVVVASGDPTWNRLLFPTDPHLPLRQIARQLKERGLRRVGGDLVIDLSLFPGRGLSLARPLGDLMAGFGAPAVALAVDQATAVVQIAPGKEPGDVATARSGTDGLEVEARLWTVGPERHGKGTVDFLPDWQQPRLLVRGEYPVSEPPYRVVVPMPAAELHAGRVLARALAAEGIEIDGEVRLSAVPAVAVGAASSRVLAQQLSPPLSAWLEPILSDSNNWWAEMLLRVLAREVSGTGRYDEGLAIKGRFLRDVVGLDEASFRLDDGSGQSVNNLLTPRAVVELLQFVDRQPWRPQWVDALARPGRGTLKSATGLPPLAAKTGTLSTARGLAGYVDPAAEQPVFFAVFIQHSPHSPTAQRGELFDAVRRFAAQARAASP